MTPNPRIQQNLEAVRERMHSACERAGRPADCVRLVAVTKYAPAEAARQLVEAGCSDLGESRPQSLWKKAEELEDLSVRWHMIGHLQRNKARRTLPLVTMIHSLDSMRLIQAVDDECRAADQTVTGLLEVNISGDEAKHGFHPHELAQVVESWDPGCRIKLSGLMGMAGLESSSSEAQRQFAALRELRDQLQAVAPEGIELTELSIGMSNDFEEAIAEGATLVRIGSTLMEGVEL